MPKVDDIIATACSEKRTYLLENESKTIMQTYEIPVTKFTVAETEDAAVKAAEKIGYPVVLKILSPDVIHKSDVGGVLININTPDEVRKGYQSIINNVQKHKTNARIKGIFVEEFAPKGIEVIIGALKDPQFGPALMFGLGGIFVEVLKDVSFRVAPITKFDAKEMIQEIKGYPILTGIRGQKASDVTALENILLQVSKLVMDYPVINQLDLNPVFSYPKGAKCVDARIILEEKS
ncbi:MAG: acetate--CoA ligase family protein [Candidatus Hermodarchaeota archaeon]|nr:acetate--CoA ligase family protein [Candidatus Hermodarchaeota archaeon]